MQGIGWQADDWEFAAVVLPQASVLDSGEIGCAKKYSESEQQREGDANDARKEASREMVSAASQMEQGHFEDGLVCAERALGAFRAQGDTAGIVDAIRLVVLALRAKGRLKDAHDLVYPQMEASSGLERARMLLLLAHINHNKRGSRNRERAKEWAASARRLFAELGESRLEAQALLALVNIVIKQHGNPINAVNETKQLVDAALPLLRQAGDVVGEAVAMHGLACARALSGFYEGAADAGRDALQLFRKAKRRRQEAFELQCLAVWRLATEEWQASRGAAEEAMAIYLEEPGTSSKQAAVLLVLTKACVVGQDFQRAIEGAFVALERFEAAGDGNAQAIALEMLALGFLQSGDFSQAAKFAEQEAALLMSLGNKQACARVLRLLCRLSMQRQDFAAATRAAAEAAALSASLQCCSEQAAALQLLADCQMRTGAFGESRDSALQARQLYRDLLDRDQEVLAMLQASQGSALLGDRPVALEVVSEAKDVARRAGRRHAEGICWHTLASLHLDWGRLADAAKMAKKALSCAKRSGSHKEQGRSVLLFVITSLMISKEFEEAAPSETPEGAEEAVLPGASQFLEAEKKAEELQQLAERVGTAEPLCTACSYHASAVVQLHKGNCEEALRAAQLALAAYEESSDLVGVLQMYLVMAKTLMHGRFFHEAREATESAAWLGHQLGFRTIEESAKSMLQEIEVREADRADRADRAPNLRRPRVIPEMPTVPKMDLQALDVEVLRGVIQQFVQVLIAHDENIDPERPLMELGLTSQHAVVLRDQLAKVLPGLSPPLPVTLIYDYPSIATITRLVEHGASGTGAQASSARP